MGTTLDALTQREIHEMNHNWQAGHEPDDIEALRAQVAEDEANLLHASGVIIELREQLAAAQARIVELREALEGLREYSMCHDTMARLLDTPDDSSALDAALEEAYSNGYDVGCADATGYMK
jgi:hypothetical protein